MRAICQRYGLPYNTGSITRPFGSMVANNFRLAFPARRLRPAAAA